MKLFDYVERVNGKVTEGLALIDVSRITAEEFSEFKSLLSYDDAYLVGLKHTESADEFYEAFEIFRECVPDEKKEELFYGMKLGYILEGVPSKLIYILRKAMHEKPTPTLAMQSINPLVWQSLLRYRLPQGTCIHDIMDELHGDRVMLINPACRMIEYEDFAEIYVENVDRIVLVPADITRFVCDPRDLMRVQYLPGRGVCVGDAPLRTMNNRVGVTLDEFDLREAI